MDVATTAEHREGVPLELFKALADANRLKIVGLLAQEPRSVEELAELTGLQAPTVSHHLKRLSGAGLVGARSEGHYSIYELRTDVLQEAAKRLLGREGLRELAAGVDGGAYERKVLATFVAPEGHITAFPTQQKKYRVVLRHVLAAFEPGRRYPEREVNDILTRFHADTARLRRSLVDFGFMAREGGGGAYWRTDES
jgi:DNA-binding transcriptional ArsR family regulator